MFSKLPVCLLIYLTSSLAVAQVYNYSTSAGTGGAGRASVEGGDSIYLNPATLPHLRGRHILASFAKDEMAFSLSDNTEESTLPGAGGYVQKKFDYLGTQVKQSDIAVSLADFVTQQFTVGITGHYFETKIENALSTSYRQTNMDLGFAYVLNGNIGLGAVLYNAFGEKNDIPEAFRLKPTIGVGMNYIYREQVRYRLDYVSAENYNFGKPQIMAGMEAFLSEFLVWRVGFHHESLTSRNLTTAGVGFNGPRFAFNYAYQGNTKESGDYRHSIDLHLPF